MTGKPGGRWSAHTDQEFVVFTIGKRFNCWWIVHCWLPMVRAIAAMIRELTGQPDQGYRGSKALFGKAIVAFRYWRPFEALEAYARAKDVSHVTALAAFDRKVGKDAVSWICHETHRIAPGRFESVFVNMPPILLGDCATLIEAIGSPANAAGRMGQVAEDENAWPILPRKGAVNDHSLCAYAADWT